MATTLVDPNRRGNRTATDRPLWGRSLRFVLVDHLMTTGQASVAEMVAHVTELGFELNGRASKVISDSLRWEVRRGRVIRIARGVYRYRSAPATTARRIRVFAARSRHWISQACRGRRPPPTPPDPRAYPWRVHFPDEPPWYNLGWLWVT